MKLFNDYFKRRDDILQQIVELLKYPYIKIVHPYRMPWNVTAESLKTYPNNTLGNKLHRFLSTNHLNLQPLYESHDIYHIISGYGIGMINEARLFFFLFGNGKKSLSVIGSIIVAIISMPDRWNEFNAAYKLGKVYKPLKNINFESVLDWDFDVLILSLEK